MLKWATLFIGLIILALGIVILVQGSQKVAGIVIAAISTPVILLGIGILLKRKPTPTKVNTKVVTTTELDEEPPVF